MPYTWDITQPQDTVKDAADVIIQTGDNGPAVADHLRTDKETFLDALQEEHVFLAEAPAEGSRGGAHQDLSIISGNLKLHEGLRGTVKVSQEMALPLYDPDRLELQVSFPYLQNNTDYLVLTSVESHNIPGTTELYWGGDHEYFNDSVSQGFVAGLPNRIVWSKNTNPGAGTVLLTPTEVLRLEDGSISAVPTSASGPGIRDGGYLIADFREPTRVLSMAMRTNHNQQEYGSFHWSDDNVSWTIMNPKDFTPRYDNNDPRQRNIWFYQGAADGGVVACGGHHGDSVNPGENDWYEAYFPQDVGKHRYWRFRKHTRDENADTYTYFSEVAFRVQTGTYSTNPIAISNKTKLGFTATFSSSIPIIRPRYKIHGSAGGLEPGVYLQWMVVHGEES